MRRFATLPNISAVRILQVKGFKKFDDFEIFAVLSAHEILKNFIKK